MFSPSQSLQSIFLTVGIGALLAMSSFGIFHFGMDMSMDGTMSACPFMPGMSVCPMTPLEHASFMQSLFATIPQQENPMLAFLLALSVGVAIGITWLRQLYAPPESIPRQLQYFHRHRARLIPRLLQDLFSSGILNPKPF